MNLLSAFKAEDRVIALIGMAKNAGKTVVLNQLIEEAYETGLNIGLSSIGRDGERQDLVTDTPKPTIYVYAGTKIATAEALLPLCEAGLEILEVTGIGTALGRIIVANVKHGGHVQIAGPATNKDNRTVADKMRHYGAEKVFIDGALDRSTSASPAIADVAVLATGAVLSREMKRVVQLTQHRVRLFALPALEAGTLRNDLNQMTGTHSVVVVEQREQGYAIKPLDLKTALGTGRHILDALNDKSCHVLISGSLVFNTIKEVADGLKEPGRITWVVQDATKLFIDDKEWHQLERWGIRLAVLKPLRLAMVSVNPYAPMGYYFDPEKFIQDVSLALPGLPVVDVVYGGSQCSSC